MIKNTQNFSTSSKLSRLNFIPIIICQCHRPDITALVDWALTPSYLLVSVIICLLLEKSAFTEHLHTSLLLAKSAFTEHLHISLLLAKSAFTEHLHMSLLLETSAFTELLHMIIS